VPYLRTQAAGIAWPLFKVIMIENGPVKAPAAARRRPAFQASMRGWENPGVNPRVHIPANQFVLEVPSRCDLACDHCYVYESIDQSWRGRPMGMSPGVVSRTAVRIAEHVKTHGLDRVEIVLRGDHFILSSRRIARQILM
jgi:hypothetical protein